MSEECPFPANLAEPTRRALNDAGFMCLDQLRSVSEAEIDQLYGMGPKALSQLREALAEQGMSFGGQRQEPRVETRQEQPYVAIPIKVPMREWGKAVALVGEVIGWLGEKGIGLAGAPFFRYWVIGDMDTAFDLEVGAPVAEAVAGDERVIAGAIPAGSYLTFTHRGHPDRLVQTLTAVEEWASSHGLEWNNRKEGESEVWGGRFEFYLTDPNVQPDPEKWAIELAYQLKDNSAQ
jgi:effector-binding domain-containing protein